jgi:phage repressor protein C with HTH and peptisase S24 domain
MSTTRPERIASTLRRAAAERDVWLDVSGDSMGRAILSGSQVEVRAAAAPRVGEIWAFCDEDGGIVVHRYRGRHDGSLVFEGDSSPHADRPITADRLIGRVVTVRTDGASCTIGRLSRWAGTVGLLRRRAGRLARRAKRKKRTVP